VNENNRANSLFQLILISKPHLLRSRECKTKEPCVRLELKLADCLVHALVMNVNVDV